MSTLTDIVQGNIRAFRKLTGKTHKQIAAELSTRISCGTTPSQSQSNERAEALPYNRLEALAEIFRTDPWQFFVKDPPDLEALKTAKEARGWPGI